MKTWIAVVAVMMQLVGLAGAGWAAPFIKVIAPVQGQCVPGPDVVVKFEAGGMTLGATAWNLHFKLDEEPFQIQYDGNHAHTFKNVRPGTHTVRVYAANAMHEAIPGTQSVVTFSVGYWDGANAPVAGQPLLTYNLPQGEYLGIDAADITVDFLLQNVQLSPGGYRVAYYVDGRRFLVEDQCAPRHIKDLAPGLHRVKIELQDQNGDIVPGAFNSTERVIAVSPDSIVKSPPAVGDGYTGLPRLDSVKGSMTMGQEWLATEPVLPPTEADLTKQDLLTVKTGKGTVALRDGEAIEYPSTASTTESSDVDKVTIIDDVDVEAGAVDGFAVRQGGEVEGTVDLDTAVPAPGARSGSILINSEEVKTGEQADITLPASEQRTVSQVETTTRTSRVRADGSISPVVTTGSLRQSTATLKLEDRPGMRAPVSDTTSTVRVDDPGTTRAKSRVETGTTSTRSRNNATTGTRADRPTTGSRDNRASTGSRSISGSPGADPGSEPPAAKLD